MQHAPHAPPERVIDHLVLLHPAFALEGAAFHAGRIVIAVPGKIPDLDRGVRKLRLDQALDLARVHRHRVAALLQKLEAARRGGLGGVYTQRTVRERLRRVAACALETGLAAGAGRRDEVDAARFDHVGDDALEGGKLGLALDACHRQLDFGIAVRGEDDGPVAPDAV